MLLMIDNYDSFTYNLVQYLGELGHEPRVVRNDACNITEIQQMAPQGIVISPGPGRPDDAGICLDVVRELGSSIPILGVCLGMQAIAQAYGARIVQAQHIMHGKASSIEHLGGDVFENIPSPFVAGRYHSLVVTDIPDSIAVTAWSLDAENNRDEVMGLRVIDAAMYGVQFHPESILSEHGHTLLENFIRLATANN